MPPIAHSKLSPSAANRWWNCPGCLALIDQCPPSKSNYNAAEGTVAHMVAELLTTGKKSIEELRAMVGQVVKQDGFDVVIDSEMVDGAILYNDVINKDIKALMAEARHADVVARTEVRVTASSITEALNGTADKIVYQKGNALKVYDYKYGKGVVVEAKNNKQGGIYVVGAEDTEAGTAYDTREFVIVQPRAPHVEGEVRRWNITKEEYQTFRGGLKEAVKRTEDPKAEVKAGSWCRWCPAQAFCPGIARAAKEECQSDFSVVPAATTARGLVAADIKLLPVERLVTALEWEEVFSSYFKAARQRVLELLEQGQEVRSGDIRYKLVKSKTNRVYKDEKAVVEHFGAILGEEQMYKKTLRSPADLEKVVGKEAIAPFVEKPEGKNTIAKDTDARSEVAPAADSDFGLMTELEQRRQRKNPLAASAAQEERKDPLAAPVAQEERKDPLAEPAVERRDPLAVPSASGSEKKDGAKTIWPQ